MSSPSSSPSVPIEFFMERRGPGAIAADEARAHARRAYQQHQQDLVRQRLKEWWRQQEARDAGEPWVEDPSALDI